MEKITPRVAGATAALPLVVMYYFLQVYHYDKVKLLTSTLCWLKLERWKPSWQQLLRIRLSLSTQFSNGCAVTVRTRTTGFNGRKHLYNHPLGKTRPGIPMKFETKPLRWMPLVNNKPRLKRLTAVFGFPYLYDSNSATECQRHFCCWNDFKG